MSINNRIKELRKEKGLTQKQLATILGISITGYASWEQELAEPNTSYIVKICNQFNVSADFLLGLVDEFGNPTKGDN